MRLPVGSLSFFAVPVLVLGLLQPALAENLNLKMGNPSGATADPSNRNNFLMEKPFFTLSYNDKNGTPNWVSWRLAADDIGTAKRLPFYADKTLPSGFKVVSPKDYDRDGFDRGHMCDHGDRSATLEASKATFVMTNMIPQAPNVNRKAWEQLESYCRELAKSGKILYTVAGPAGSGGTGSNGSMTGIGADDQVAVPAKCWKVIMVLDSDDVTKISASTRMIAVIMPNDMSVGEEWAGFRVSVASVESLTGYKFFDKVNSSVLATLKAKVDTEAIPAPIPHRSTDDIAH